MIDPLLQLIAVAVRHIGEVADLKVRAAVIDSAAVVCEDNHYPKEAAELRTVAADLRKADQAQLQLNELFSQFATF